MARCRGAQLFRQLRLAAEHREALVARSPRASLRPSPWPACTARAAPCTSSSVGQLRARDRPPRPRRSTSCGCPRTAPAARPSSSGPDSSAIAAERSSGSLASTAHSSSTLRHSISKSVPAWPMMRVVRRCRKVGRRVRAAVIDRALHLAVAFGQVEAVGVEIIEVGAIAEVARDPAARRLHRDADAVVLADEQHRRRQLLVRGPLPPR